MVPGSLIAKPRNANPRPGPIPNPLPPGLATPLHVLIPPGGFLSDRYTRALLEPSTKLGLWMLRAPVL